MFDRRTFFRVGAGVAAAATALPWQATAAASGAPNWTELRSALTGQLILPTDAGYAGAGQLSSAQFDTITPAAVAYCATAADVSTCVTFAVANGVHAVPRSGGHSAAGYSTVQNGLVIDLSRLNSVTMNDSGTLRIGGGAQSVDILATAQGFGVQAVSGLCATVGHGGFVQGGGTGFQSRKFGLGCDRMVSADLVLADGRQVHCSADVEPDLFWAIRGGGGGNFGVVTAFEEAPIDAPTQVNYSLTWDLADATDVLAGWQPWIFAGPVELASSVEVNPAFPGAPTQVSVQGAYLGTQAPADALLDELVAAIGIAPVSRSAAEAPYDQAMMSLYGCASKTVDQCHRVGYTPAGTLFRTNYATSRNLFLCEPMSTSDTSTMLTAYEANPASDEFRILSVFALGGRINEPGRTDTAFVHRDSALLVSYTSSIVVPSPSVDQQTAAQQWANNCYSVTAPFANGESYQNFIDPALTDWQSAYYAENYPRLRYVKQKYDPHGFFSFPQSIR